MTNSFKASSSQSSLHSYSVLIAHISKGFARQLSKSFYNYLRVCPTLKIMSIMDEFIEKSNERICNICWLEYRTMRIPIANSS